MLYWTDDSRGMKEIPFVFNNKNPECKEHCPFKDKVFSVCSCGFLKMKEMGCITTFESSEERENG